MIEVTKEERFRRLTVEAKGDWNSGMLMEYLRSRFGEGGFRLIRGGPKQVGPNKVDVSIQRYVVEVDLDEGCNIVRICNAYESGLGRRNLLNPHSPSSSEWGAWDYGYKEGNTKTNSRHVGETPT